MDSHDTLIAPRPRATPLGEAAHRESPPADQAPGRSVLDRYRLLERLGAGGFGVVWRARDTLLGREVAVKVVPLPPDEDSARATREALAAARLSHPSIVALYEACVEDGAFYLISELVRGETLARLIAEDALRDEEILQIGLALADALLHAHRRGVVHRDLKPQNVLVCLPTERVARPAAGAPSDGAPVAKLTDFGGALLAGEESLTRTGDVLGTIAYMAPEQLDGHEVDARADLYSLALVLYEALSAVHPVRGPTPAATARRIGSRLAPLARHRRDLPRELTLAFDRALHPDPHARGTLAELREALLPHVASAAVEGPPRAPVLEEPDAAAAEGPPGISVPEEPDTGGWLTRARLIWLAATLAVCVWQLVLHRPGVALIVLCAVLPLLALVRRPGVRWLAAVLAPTLGLAGLATAFPALAGQAVRWRSRALLGVLGYWWLRLAELPLGGDGMSAVRATPHLVSAALPLGAALWALAAMVLPWLVRGRSAVHDALAAILWASALAATPALLDRSLPSARAVLPSSREVILGAALGAAIAVVARALLGPARATAA